MVVPRTSFRTSWCAGHSDHLTAARSQPSRRWSRKDFGGGRASTTSTPAPQQQIGALDPGQARWEDLERFATDQLGARPVGGYSALRFRFENAEVVEASESVNVIDIAGRH